MIKKIVRSILAVIFLFGLIYLIAPGPSSIADIAGLPGAFKSDEPGDT